MTVEEQSKGRSHVDRAPTRLVVTMVVMTLIAALSALAAPGVSANELGQRIGSARRSQGYYESLMLRADRAVARLDQKYDLVKRDMKRALRPLKRTRSRRAEARKVVHVRAAQALRIEKQAPKEGEEVPEGFEARLRRAQAKLTHASKVERRWDANMRRIWHHYDVKHRKLKVIRRTMRPAIRSREAAEGALGGLIVSATRLAQQQAELKTATPLGPAGTFVWPTLGGVTQGYGCTGYVANPRRGSCSHFHDGYDISPSGGTRIGTVATGVIAYVGWNPWDAEGRAFIVVVGHADGYVSRYGHLLPNRRVAHAGQVVWRGQTLGYMGSTGNSTGVHLHVEILRNGSTVDPGSLLPDRGKDGKAKHDKKKSDKKKSDKKKTRRATRRRRRASEATGPRARPSESTIGRATTARMVGAAVKTMVGAANPIRQRRCRSTTRPTPALSRPATRPFPARRRTRQRTTRLH